MHCQISFPNRFINYTLYNDYGRKFYDALAFTIEVKKRIDFAIEGQIMLKLWVYFSSNCAYNTGIGSFDYGISSNCAYNRELVSFDYGLLCSNYGYIFRQIAPITEGSAPSIMVYHQIAPITQGLSHLIMF